MSWVPPRRQSAALECMPSDTRDTAMERQVNALLNWVIARGVLEVGSLHVMQSCPRSEKGDCGSGKHPRLFRRHQVRDANGTPLPLPPETNCIVLTLQASVRRRNVSFGPVRGPPSVGLGLRVQRTKGSSTVWNV